MTQREYEVLMLRINLHHCKTAAASLCGGARMMQTGVYLIQEPYFYMGRIRGLSSQGKLHDVSGIAEVPRACVIATGNIRTRIIAELCSSEVVAVRSSGQQGPVICASVCMADSEQCPPQKMIDQVSYCDKNN